MIRFGILCTRIDKTCDSCGVMYTREQSRKQFDGLPLDLTEGPGATSKNNKTVWVTTDTCQSTCSISVYDTPPSPPYTKGSLIFLIPQYYTIFKIRGRRDSTCFGEICKRKKKCLVRYFGERLYSCLS